jgi:hypothetical protein
LFFCVIIVIGLMLFTINHATAPGEIAGIEQIRKDTNLINPESAEGIYRLAAEANKGIASNQAYNKIWWSAMLVPDKWDKVEFIIIPSSK